MANVRVLKLIDKSYVEYLVKTPKGTIDCYTPIEFNEKTASSYKENYVIHSVHFYEDIPTEDRKGRFMFEYLLRGFESLKFFDCLWEDYCLDL